MAPPMTEIRDPANCHILIEVLAKVDATATETGLDRHLTARLYELSLKLRSPELERWDSVRRWPC